MADKPTTVKGAWSRRMSAAKRSLKLVRDVADQHDGLLKSGQVPEGDFTIHAVKYAQALGELRLLAMVTEDGADAYADNAADGSVEVSREDVAFVVQLARAFVPAPALQAGADALLGRLETASAPAPEQPSGAT